MTDGPGQPVEDGFLVFVDMTMGMGDAVGVEICVIVMFVMVGHVNSSGKRFYRIISHFLGLCKPR